MYNRLQNIITQQQLQSIAAKAQNDAQTVGPIPEPISLTSAAMRPYHAAKTAVRPLCIVSGQRLLFDKQRLAFCKVSAIQQLQHMAQLNRKSSRSIICVTTVSVNRGQHGTYGQALTAGCWRAPLCFWGHLPACHAGRWLHLRQCYYWHDTRSALASTNQRALCAVAGFACHPCYDGGGAVHGLLETSTVLPCATARHQDAALGAPQCD